jgi:hypothetical protein
VVIPVYIAVGAFCSIKIFVLQCVCEGRCIVYIFLYFSATRRWSIIRTTEKYSTRRKNEYNSSSYQYVYDCDFIIETCTCFAY